MNVFFTSDTHFGHRNVIEYCKRPFGSIEEMDAMIIRNWNATVAPDDLVFHLGDFSLTNNKIRLTEWFSQLNGQKRLIAGNHDGGKCLGLEWVGVDNYDEYKFNGRTFIMFHYPIASWNGMSRGSIHLHGHSHGNYEFDSNHCIDVGVDCWGFKPVNLMDIIARADSGVKPIRTTDQHRGIE